MIYTFKVRFQRILKLTLLWAIASSASAKEFREFTSADGKKTLKAVVVTNIDGKFQIELEKGKKMTVSPTAFSEEDQAYLKKWAEENISYNFVPKIKKASAGKPRNGVREGWNYHISNYCYEIDLENRTRYPLEDIEVRYQTIRLVYTAETRSASDAEREFTTGKHKISKLDAKATMRVKTKSFPIIRHRLAKGYFLAIKGDDRFTDRTGGVWIKVFHKGKEVYEYKTEDKAIRTEDWQGSSPSTSEGKIKEDK